MGLADRSNVNSAILTDPAENRAPDRLCIAAQDIAPLRALAQSLGIVPPSNPPEPGDAPGGTDAEITLSEFFLLFRQLMAVAPDETLSMSRRPLAPGTMDFVVETVQGAQTLEDAMRRVARAFNHVHGGFYNRVERTRDRIAYLIDDRDFPYVTPVTREATEGFMHGVLIFLHAILSLAVGRPLCEEIVCIRSRRARRSTPDGLLSFWSAPVKIASATYAIEYKMAAATLPVRFELNGTNSASAVFDAIETMIARRSDAPGPKDFKSRVEACLDQGISGQTDVARRLGVSPATMRRRLTIEGVTFRELRAASLAAMGRRMIEQGRPVADVADHLGFADMRSFSRAFKRRFGVTPTHFAEKRKATPEPTSRS